MFDGEKVILRQFELEDLDILVTKWNNISFMKELGMVAPKSRDEIAEWIRKGWKEKQEGKAYYFAIIEKKANTILGFCSLKNVRIINRSATITIAIFNENDRGKGYGKDSLRVMLFFGFSVLNLHRISLNVFETNQRAISAYEKVGFKRVGLARETDFIEGRYVNDVIMDILEHEWRILNKTTNP